MLSWQHLKSENILLMHRTEILIRAQTRMKHIQCDSTAWIHSRWSLWHNVCGKYKWLPWKPISSLVRIWRCLWYLPRWRGRWGWLYEISFFFLTSMWPWKCNYTYKKSSHRTFCFLVKRKKKNCQMNQLIKEAFKNMMIQLWWMLVISFHLMQP